MSLRLMRHLYESYAMDQDQLRMDLEYITQVRDLPAEESLRRCWRDSIPVRKQLDCKIDWSII